jgi:uncharacterized DUF497 family protein
MYTVHTAMLKYLRMADQPGFEWDEANIRHLARHHVTPPEFEEAMLRDPILLHYENMDAEDRWTALGATGALRVLVMAFTIREARLRAARARSQPGNSGSIEECKWQPKNS